MAELARKLGVGRSTVQERIARLERSGLIAGYAAILSHDPFGDAAQALVMVSIVQRRQKDILDRLRALPEVVSCLTIAGDYDLVLTVPAEQVGRALTDVRAMGGRFQPPEPEGAFSVLTGAVPAAELGDYADTLAAYTQGRGRLQIALRGYEPCHDEAKVIGEMA